jgi:CheY-like chemotaxis protein
MMVQALLISSDDAAAQVVGRVLPSLGIAVDRSNDAEAAEARIQAQRFDALVADFDDARVEQVIQQAHKLNAGHPPVTVALVADAAKVRGILNSGAHFVLYKPLTEDSVRAGLRAAVALLSRERRRAVRVPVQAPVEITLPGMRALDGILLDLSETGMDVLTASPQTPETLFSFRCTLPDNALQIEGQGRVVWANPNGQTGVRFLNPSKDLTAKLQSWLRAAVIPDHPEAQETVPDGKLTDLSLGGCYVETGAPFPEGAMVDLCLRTDEMEVHTEGMVRVAHPGHGMGVEFPSRTAEQRAQVGNLISFLRGCPQTSLALHVSPRALVADITQFERAANSGEEPLEDLEDPLLELLRRGKKLQQEEFLLELQHQRTPSDAAPV